MSSGSIPIVSERQRNLVEKTNLLSFLRRAAALNSIPGPGKGAARSRSSSPAPSSSLVRCNTFYF